MCMRGCFENKNFFIGIKQLFVFFWFILVWLLIIWKVLTLGFLFLIKVDYLIKIVCTIFLLLFLIRRPVPTVLYFRLLYQIIFIQLCWAFLKFLLFILAYIIIINLILLVIVIILILIIFRFICMKCFQLTNLIVSVHWFEIKGLHWWRDMRSAERYLQFIYFIGRWERHLQLIILWWMHLSRWSLCFIS